MGLSHIPVCGGGTQCSHNSYWQHAICISEFVLILFMRAHWKNMEEDGSLTITVTTTVTQMFPNAMTRLSAVFRQTVRVCVCDTVGGSVLVCLFVMGFSVSSCHRGWRAEQWQKCWEALTEIRKTFLFHQSWNNCWKTTFAGQEMSF